MSIDIRPINILFDTNIPGKQIIPFTKSLLYNPVLKDIGNLNEYPYFTINLLFPYSYLSSLPYEKQVSFFFNKSEMLKVLKIHNASYFKKNTYITEEPNIFTEREKKEMKEKEDLSKKDAYEKKKKEYEIKEELKKLEERRNRLQIQINRENEEEEKKRKKEQSNINEKTNKIQLDDIIFQINYKRKQLTDISNKEFNEQGNQEDNTPPTNDVKFEQTVKICTKFDKNNNCVENDDHENDDHENDDDENEYNDETIQNKNGNENVLTMLRLLFPTKYPIVGNIFSSFNSIILKRSEFKISFSDFLPSFLKNKLIEGNASYSYVKIDGKIYTIAQVIWLNDIYNHKEYSELIHKLINLNTWKKKALKNLNEEIKIKL